MVGEVVRVLEARAGEADPPAPRAATHTERGDDVHRTGPVVIGYRSRPAGLLGRDLTESPEATLAPAVHPGTTITSPR